MLPGTVGQALLGMSFFFIRDTYYTAYSEGHQQQVKWMTEKEYNSGAVLSFSIEIVFHLQSSGVAREQKK